MNAKDTQVLATFRSNVNKAVNQEAALDATRDSLTSQAEKIVTVLKRNGEKCATVKECTRSYCKLMNMKSKDDADEKVQKRYNQVRDAFRRAFGENGSGTKGRKAPVSKRVLSIVKTRAQAEAAIKALRAEFGL